MEQKQVIDKITELGRQILPQGTSLWLYGSRARGDAHPDSDYDLLILIDKDKASTEDFNNYGYPFCEMGYDMFLDISPRIYTRKRWNETSFSPFHKNVEQDKIVLI